MSNYQKIYFVLLGTTFFLSVWRNKDTSLRIFTILLSISFITEIINYFTYKFLHNQTIENFIYQIYIPVEFALLALFFFENTNNLFFKRIIMASIFLFFIIDFIIGYNVGFNIFPGHVLI